MLTEQYYYISTLPMLGELGSTPAMGLADLVEHVSEQPRWRKLINAVVLLDDLQQRESFLSGELEEVEPAVLTLQQVRNQAPLPEFLVTPEDQEQHVGVEVDVLWRNYFHHVAALGRSEKVAFLVKWAAFEVGLRNALATARAKRLGLNEASYLVATDLMADDEDWSAVLATWEAAADPLAGLRAVIRARWDWVARHEAWFAFTVDELLVYVVRVMLLEQWRRLSERDEAVSGGADG
jgi:hypothetical protein